MSFFFFFKFLLKQDAYTINVGVAGGVTGGRWVGEGGGGQRGVIGGFLAGHFLVWFVHGLELLQHGGGGDDAGRS